MKNLKSEYQDLMKSEMPDLWDKISTQLGDNSEGAVTPEHIQEYNNAEITPVKQRNYYKYGTLIAACICIALFVPLIISRQNDYKEAEISMAETGVEISMAERVETEVEISAETQTEQVFNSNNSEFASEGVTFDAENDMIVYEESEFEVLDETVQGDMDIKVLEISKDDTLTDSDKIYTAKVLQNSQELDLQKDDIIKLQMNSGLTGELQEDVSYHVFVEPESAETGIYRISSYQIVDEE